jgi:hypothetical protein
MKFFLLIISLVVSINVYAQSPSEIFKQTENQQKNDLDSRKNLFSKAKTYTCKFVKGVGFAQNVLFLTMLNNQIHVSNYKLSPKSPMPEDDKWNPVSISNLKWTWEYIQRDKNLSTGEVTQRVTGMNEFILASRELYSVSIRGGDGFKETFLYKCEATSPLSP